MKQNTYSILTPQICGTLAEQCEDIRVQLKKLLSERELTLQSLLQARLYLSDAANQWGAMQDFPLTKELTATGVLSYIEQPPLGGSKVTLLLWFTGEAVKSRVVEQLEDGCVAEIKTEKLTYLLQSVRYSGENLAPNAVEQTRQAFASHIAQLKKRGATLRDNCQRTWFFVRDVDRHYAQVVSARNEVFAREGLTPDTHYIASTGIGGASAPTGALVAADFFSVIGLEAGRVGYLHAPDYLNPTQEYGVAFERGTYLDLPSTRLFLVSGTASIDNHGACLFRGDVSTQTGRLLLNINKLLQSAGGALTQVRYFIIYLRDVADYHLINTYMHLRFPHIPYLITEARVCRPEWLIEMECVAEA